MWDLLCSVFFSSLIFVVFRLYDTYKVDTFHAIVVNYITAFSTGLLLYSGKLSPTQVFSQSWAGGALLLGVLFIVIFNVMALTSQRHGVGVASVATKMSLVIPVIAGLILYDEYLSPLQVAGIILALAAVYFTSHRKANRSDGKDLRILYLPLMVFLGSGIIDTAIKYLQETRVSPSEYPLFSASIFGFASLAGFGILLIKDPSGLKRFNRRNLLGGLVLGIPNYFSVYFLLRALQYEGLNSASVFALNNVSIVMLTTLLGILLFREQLRPTNWIGVGLAVVSIVLISIF